MRIFKHIPVAILVLATGVTASAADPRLGTWKLNHAKSVSASGSLPQSYVCTYTDAGGGAIRFVADVITAKGEKRQPTWVDKGDGKEVPVTGSPLFDAIINKLAPEGKSGSWVVKKEGQEVGGGKWTQSSDGKILTWDLYWKTKDGKQTTSKYVLDRQ